MGMEAETKGHLGGNGWDPCGLKEVNAVICIAGCTLAAATYRMQQQRLLDVLNSSLVADSYRIGREFVPLTNVEAFFWSGEREYLKSTHINKWSILFVAERSGGLPERSEVREADACPVRPKKAVPAKVSIPPYDLVGKLHTELGQGLVHLLDGEEMFLPMTDVIVSPPLPTGECQFSFAAINKHQIVSVTELQEIPQAPKATTRKVRRRVSRQ